MFFRWFQFLKTQRVCFFHHKAVKRHQQIYQILLHVQTRNELQKWQNVIDIFSSHCAVWKSFLCGMVFNVIYGWVFMICLIDYCRCLHAIKRKNTYVLFILFSSFCDFFAVAVLFFNSLWREQYGRHYADIFRSIFFSETFGIINTMLYKRVPPLGSNSQ